MTALLQPVGKDEPGLATKLAEASWSSGRVLVKEHPPVAHHPNKEVLFDLGSKAVSDRAITLSRWRPAACQTLQQQDQAQTSV